MRSFFVSALATAATAAYIQTDMPLVGDQNVSGMSIRELLMKNAEEAAPLTMEDFTLQTTNMIESLTDHIRSHKHLNAAQSNSGAQQQIYTCETRAPSDLTTFGNFLPIYAGAAGPQTPTIETFQGRCFDFDIEWLGYNEDQSQFQLSVKASQKMSATCSDTLWFANTEMDHLEIFFVPGTHILNFDVKDEDMMTDLDFSGLKVFQFCGGIRQELLSLWNSVILFAGGLSDHSWLPYIGSHTPPYQEKANIEFIKEAMGIEIEERDTYEVDFPEDLIQSGDFLAITRLDGLDQIIGWATGGIAGHSVLCLWFPDERGKDQLYVVESQDSWYWPTHGLQRTPYKTWMKQAKEASFNVVLMPLKAEAIRKFDVEATRQFFFETEGLPYGMHNFIYGWLDTERDNLPPALANEFLPIFGAIGYSIAPKTFDIVYSQALNKRLGTEGLSPSQIAATAARRGMTTQQVIAMPEQDGWVYSGIEPRDGLSYVCSAYVAALYKAGGMFGDLEINATEWVPRDIYELNIFDKEFKRPQACIDADPTLPYCQLIGKYRFDYTFDYSWVEMYDHMDEHCSSINPTYFRPEGC